MIRYLLSLALGVVVGVGLCLCAIYFNPFAARSSLSPLAVSDFDVATLNYSAVAADTLVYTNDGESRVDPHPPKVLQLWEAPIRRTAAMAAVLRDSRGNEAGIGIKIASESESTNILHGRALVDSVWHVYLPGRGSLFVEQRENYWNYLREIVVPAFWSSSNSWQGSWTGNLTSGPGALGTARVTGGSGEFAGLKSDGVESLTVKAYSLEQGPVLLDGRLAIELPATEAAVTPDP